MNLIDMDDEIRDAGAENLARLESNLRRNKDALQYLYDRGVSHATIKKFRLGIKEPYQRKSDREVTSNVLCYPLLSATGRPLGRYGFCNIPGVTDTHRGESFWGAGRPRTYHSAEVGGKSRLLVVDNCRELWICDQHLNASGAENRIIVVTSTHGFEIPEEWKMPAFWSSWATV